MKKINSICIFCGSSSGKREIYTQQAIELTKLMVERDIIPVYGGSNVGIMRVIADTALTLGSEVIGVMPHHLIEREVAHRGITTLIEVHDMAERKAKMAELSDAFIALPGGIGTLDELFEMMSWNQLELMEKPVALFNIDNYFDHLIAFLQHATEEMFMKREHFLNLIIEDNAANLLDKIENYTHIKVDGGKWIKDLKNNTYLK